MCHVKHSEQNKQLFCSRCGTSHDRHGQRYCCSCHAAYTREWRKGNPPNDGQRRRDVARSYARVYKMRGLIKREPCRVCGSGDSQMHHPDHELPKVVIWLCRGCHLRWHAFWRSTLMNIFNEWASKSVEEFRRKSMSVS